MVSPIILDALPGLLEQRAMEAFQLCRPAQPEQVKKAQHLAMISHLHAAKLHRALYGMNRRLHITVPLHLAPYYVYFGSARSGLYPPAWVEQAFFVQGIDYRQVPRDFYEGDMFGIEIWCGCCGTLRATFPSRTRVHVIGACPLRHGNSSRLAVSNRLDPIRIELNGHGLGITAFGRSLRVPRARFQAYALLVTSPRGSMGTNAPWLDYNHRIPELAR
jgi:hypothetical protein